MGKLLLLSLTCLTFLAGGLHGQTTVAVPDDAKFVVQLDVATFAKTRLGSQLLELTQKMAEEEIGDDSEDVIQKVEETIGFNPLEEIRSVTIIGCSFEEPEKDLRLIIQMGENTGNLEGLVLAAPGYESEEHGDYLIHSAKQDDMQAFATIHTSQAGNKTILAASQREQLMEMLDATSVRGKKRRQIQWTVPEKTFAQVQILEFPEEIYEHNPPGNIARMIKDLSITVAEASNDYEFKLKMTTEDEKRAEQIQQLAQGAKALVGIFESEIGDDEDAKMIMSLLDTIVVEREHETVQLSVSIPEDLIIEFLREEADLPL